MKDYFPSKNLTRDYQSFSKERLFLLDIMVARRSYRKYDDWGMDPEIEKGFESYFKRSKELRECDETDVIYVNDKDKLSDLFKTAYSGMIGKINPFLPKSKAAGLMALSIHKDARHADRPLGFARPSLVGEDCIMYLTENSLGSVWLAGVNSTALAEALLLPSHKWIPAIIIFGKTDNKKPGGFNWDAITYKTVSRRRKDIREITNLNYFNNEFEIPESLSQKIEYKPLDKIVDIQKNLAVWNNKTREITQLEWELLCESARLAPSASNKQPWKFIVVNDKTVIEELKKTVNITDEVSGFIAALGLSGTIYEVGFERPFWMIDVPIAMSHITLMASSLHISSKIFFDIPETDVNKILKLNNQWRTTALIALK